MTEPKYIAWLSFILAAGFAYLEVFHVELTNDTNYFMHCALRLWRYGTGHLYDRCVDENFPYHIVLYAPLAAFAAYTQFNLAILLHGACAFLCVLSLIVMARSLKAHGVNEKDGYLWLAASAFALLILPSIYGVFADREHFLFILALPWLIQMLLRLKPFNSTCVMAGFGFLMKPHDFVLFGVMTLLAGPSGSFIKDRLLSRSTLIISTMAAIYLTLTVLFFPKFVFEILPYALVIYPSKYYTFRFKVGYAFKYILIAIGIILAFIQSLWAAVPWFGFIIGCAIVLFLNAGWDYTFYLSAVPMVMTFALPWVRGYGAFRVSSGALIKSVKLMFAITFFMCVFSICTETGILQTTAFRNHTTVDPRLASDIRSEAGDKMIILSTELWTTQVEQFGKAPEAVFGYDTIWTYLWLAQHPASRYYNNVMHSLTSNFVNALRDNPTAVIFDDISPRPQITNDGILGFLARDIQVQNMLLEYKSTKTIDYCSDSVHFACRFAVLKRQDIKAP